MNIIKAVIKWRYPLSPLKNVDFIIIHHIETFNATVGDIHQWHLNNGQKWKGVGYNFYIRKNGNIYECRGYKEGAHAKGYNDKSLGIALEGNFNKEKPTKEQIESLIEFCKFLKNKHPKAEIKEHKELNNTDCCGDNFNIDEIRDKVNNENYYKEKLIEIKEFIDEILKYGGV